MKINVPEKYADLYLKTLAEKKKILEAKIRDFRKEIEEIDNYISSITSLPIFQDNPSSYSIPWKIAGYQAQWTWTRKIAHYQELKLRIFTSSELIDFIVENEQNLNKSKVRSSISAALSNKHKTGSYRKFLDPITGTAYYGPSQWFIKDHEPHPNYLPDILKRRLPGN